MNGAVEGAVYPEIAIDLNLAFDDGTTTSLDVPDGVLQAQQPVGSYRVYINVLEESVPIMVEARDQGAMQDAIQRLEGAARSDLGL